MTEADEIVATMTEIVRSLNLPAWLQVDISTWWGHYPRNASEPERFILVELTTGNQRSCYEPLIRVEEAAPRPYNAVLTPLRRLLEQHYGKGAGEIIAQHLLPPLAAP